MYYQVFSSDFFLLSTNKISLANYLYHDVNIFILQLPALPPVVLGCVADSECPQDKACFNGNCVNPCNCGLNAECVVIQHTPLCFCPPGYSGDPRVECQKCKFVLHVD